MSFTADINEIVEENRNGLLGKRAHWKRVRLGEVASILNGAPFESGRFKKDPGTPLIRIRDVVRGHTETYYDGEYDDAYLVQHGDLLIGMDGDFNCELWAGEPALLNQRVCKITPDESRYSKQFLRYVLPGYLAAINEQTPSITVKHLSSRTVADIPLPLPPVNEQREIVAKLDQQFTRLDAGAVALRRVQANLKRYRAAVLKAACEGRLVPTEAELARAESRTYETGEQLLARILADRRKNWQGRGKYKEPAAPDTTNLPPLPEGWAWTSVEQLADIGSGNTPAKISDYAKPDGAIPWFKVGDMNRLGNEQIMRSAEAYLRHEDVHALGLRLFPSGTIIFPKRGGAIATNKKRLLEAAATTDLNVMGLTPDVRVFGYFKHWFSSIDLASLSDGSNVPQVNNKDIQPLMVPLPPLVEQTRIVAEVERRLSVVEEVGIISADILRATRLRQSILRRAFSGNL